MRVVVATILVISLLLVTAGCGGAGVLSSIEYQEKVGQLQESAIGTLGVARDELCAVDSSDYFGLQELQQLLDESGEFFRSAYQEALHMNTPPQVEELHEELLLFYSFVEEKIGEMASAVAFFQSVLPMLTDVGNLALPNISEDSEVARIKATSEEDGVTMHGYLKDLKGIEPPPLLRPYQDNLIVLFRSIEEAVAGVERAVTPEDRETFQQFQEEFPEVLKEVFILKKEIAVYLLSFCQRIEIWLEESRELAGRIEEV